MPRLKPGEMIIVPQWKIQEASPLIRRILQRAKQEELQAEREAIGK